ncbi:MAG TPA: DUF1003 domain-containing protein [Mariprofundaceae bacterium]|nr:DUF1003 domain-containing protein [Mariprofundaceae bacterium]
MKQGTAATHHTCSICGKSFPRPQIVPAASVRTPVSDIIRREHPAWSENDFICSKDLTRYRTQYVESVLEAEKGELTALEQEVVESLVQHELLSANIESEYERELSFGERMADRMAEFGGSWAFLIIFVLFVVIWIVINSAVLIWKPADPYPFILLNLLLSCLAAVQAPIIMMSQNRQEIRDRLRAENDYKVNLKAELEIQHLNEKVDHLLQNQWQRLVEIQQLQIELLHELAHDRHER